MINFTTETQRTDGENTDREWIRKAKSKTLTADGRRFTQILLGFVQGPNEAASYSFLAASFYFYQ